MRELTSRHLQRIFAVALEKTLLVSSDQTYHTKILVSISDFFAVYQENVAEADNPQS